MSDDRVEVRDSKLGQAVFAISEIPAGVRVGQITGRIHFQVETESDYAIDLGDSSVLDPIAPFRFLNHSCAPNCELILWEHEDEPPQMWVHSTTEIAADEELTIDYAWIAECAIPCLCSAVNCRGWIVREDELPLLTGSS